MKTTSILAVAPFALGLATGAAPAATLDNGNNLDAYMASHGTLPTNAVRSGAGPYRTQMPAGKSFLSFNFFRNGGRAGSSHCDYVSKHPSRFSTVEQDFCSGQTNGDNR
jgi:hypothetical protein